MPAHWIRARLLSNLSRVQARRSPWEPVQPCILPDCPRVDLVAIAVCAILTGKARIGAITGFAAASLFVMGVAIPSFVDWWPRGWDRAPCEACGVVQHWDPSHTTGQLICMNCRMAESAKRRASHPAEFEVGDFLSSHPTSEWGAFLEEYTIRRQNPPPKTPN